MNNTMKINVKIYDRTYFGEGKLILEKIDMEIKREGEKHDDILRAFPGWKKKSVNGNEMWLLNTDRTL